LFRNFRPMHDRLNFQLRWEIYNALNHPSFYRWTLQLGSAPREARSTRLGQYVDSRRPRQMQIALRLSF
jgi:hypothetical protein